jgi:hypothetical protein
MAEAQLSVYGTAGMSGLKYKIAGGNADPGFGLGGGIGYSLALNPSWKAGAAVEMAKYGSKASFGTLSDAYSHGTGEAKSLFSYSLKDYEEKQSLTMLSIPIMLHYRTGNSIKFDLSGGIKLGLPVNAKASINPGIISASGEYEYEGQTYTDLPQHGFPEGIKLPETKCDIDLNCSAAAALEAGVLLKKIYAGAYLEYGLTNMQKTKDRHAIEYPESGSSTLVHNSILNTGLVDKIRLFSLGVKIGIQFF